MSCCGKPGMNNFIDRSHTNEHEMVCVGPPDWQLLQQHIEASLIEIIEVEIIDGIHTAVKVRKLTHE